MKVRIVTDLVLDCTKPNGGRTANPASKSIDWNDSSDRKWLANHLHWAVNNGRVVSIAAVPAA